MPSRGFRRTPPWAPPPTYWSKRGTVILSRPRIIGAEQILARRCVDAETRERLSTSWSSRRAHSALREHAGGVHRLEYRRRAYTLEEKSLGCIRKGTSRCARSSPSEAPEPPGLVVMDTPGHDVASMIGMVAGGAQVICFTTGRGTPTGCPVAPVIKVCSNTETSRHMADNIDLDAARSYRVRRTSRWASASTACSGGGQRRAHVLGASRARRLMIGRRREIGACPRGNPQVLRASSVDRAGRTRRRHGTGNSPALPRAEGPGRFGCRKSVIPVLTSRALPAI